MHYPKITIVTPTFNQGEFIEQTIISILDQNYPNLEYIIVDAGSNDKTVSIIKKYEKHLAWWVSEKDRGQSHAINKGLEKSGGDVFNWVNSDDYLAEGALQVIGERFMDRKISVLCGRMKMFWQDTGKESVWTPTRVSNSLSKMIGFSSNRQPSTWFRLDILRRIGPLNEHLHFTMDQDMWVRYLLSNGKKGIVQTDKILLHFRRHNESKTEKSNQGFNKDIVSIFVSLLTQTGIPSCAEQLRNLTGVKAHTDYNLLLPESYLKINQKKIYNYFLLRMTENYIGKKDKKSSEKFYREINPIHLNLRDINYYLKLRGRIRNL